MTPWYAHMGCRTCSRRVGPDGVYINMVILFCRPCAERVRAAIEAPIK